MAWPRLHYLGRACLVLGQAVLHPAAGGAQAAAHGGGGGKQGVRERVWQENVHHQDKNETDGQMFYCRAMYCSQRLV